jgi:hypothetical protein
MNQGIFSRLLLTSCLASTCVVMGCADASPDEGAVSGESGDVQGVENPLSKPIARAERGGFALTYYEVEGGGILELASGASWSRDVDLGADLDYVQRYELVARAKAPAALVAAAARLGETRHDFDPIPTEEVQEDALTGIVRLSDKGITQGSFSDESWFRANYCVNTDSFWGGPTTPGWYFIGNRSWGGDKKIKYMKAGVWAMQGWTSVKFDYSGAGFPDQWYGIDFAELGHQWVAARGSTLIQRRAGITIQATNNDLYLACLNYRT